jgi:microcystin-dependent protein
MTSVLRQTSAFMAHQKPVVGDMKMSFVGYDHLGWLLCNGASLSIADNELLYKVIGKQFGSVDATHFNLPNPAGRVAGVVGYNSIVGTINHPPGQVIGEETHVLLYTEMPAHNHDIAGRTQNVPVPPVTPAGPVGYTSIESTGIYLTDPGHTHTGTTNSSGSSSGVQDVIDTVLAVNTTINVAAQGSHTHTFTTANNVSNVTLTDPDHRHSIAVNGMDQPHNNMQPTLFMGNMFIYSGVPTLGYWPYTIGMDAPEFMTPALNPPLI